MQAFFSSSCHLYSFRRRRRRRRKKKESNTPDLLHKQIFSILNKSMIIIQRQDYVHKLCILCTCFMLITSIFNILFIIRRYSSSTSTSTSDDADNKNIEFIKPSIISTNDITESNRTKSKSDLFEKTYRKFLRSFMNSYSTLNQSNQISYCPEIPPDLLGPIIIEDPPANFSISNQSIYHPNVLLGGSHQPKTCLARHKIAIIVPYRDRQEILRHFLYHTHLFLQRQQLDYRIYLCEQAYDKVFNKGIVMNSCFKEILKLEPSTPCFIMHDVDLLLIDDRNMYTCPMNPRHLSVAIDKFHFYLPYKELVGGVLGKKKLYTL